MEDLDKVKMG